MAGLRAKGRERILMNSIWRGAFPLAQWLIAVPVLLPLRGQHQIFTDFPYTNNRLFRGGIIEGFIGRGKRPIGRMPY
jgi:hypothetical protein